MDIKVRCFSPKAIGYKDYGGRGITMCAEWRHGFAAFLRDVGKRPSDYHQIERIDNNGHYEPGNVRWASAVEQASNRRSSVYIIVGGQKMTVEQAARHFDVNRISLGRRIRIGNNPDKAIALLKQAGSKFVTRSRMGRTPKSIAHARLSPATVSAPTTPPCTHRNDAVVQL